MSNYNKIIDRYDRLFLYYLNNIIGHLSKPKTKFYIVYGILKSKSVLLSNIAHSLNEKILLKKTIERLSNFLSSEIEEEIHSYHYRLNLSLMPTDLKLFIVDDTDVTKLYGKRFESLGRVKDGSAIRVTYEKC